MSGAYHRRRGSPPLHRPGSRRARGRGAGAAQLRPALPGRATPGGHALGQCRRGARVGRAARLATSPSRVGSTPRTSSRTTPTGRSSCGGPGSSSDTGSDWVTVDEHTTAVAFEVRDGLDAIAIDHDALDAGLVVVPRESVGTAADAPDRVPAGTAPDAPMRLVVEQVSSVEHAVVLGVPVPGEGDAPTRMTAGLGRPLILTTLEPAEAMRILAADGPRRPLVAAMALALGLASLTIGIVWAVLGAMTATALAASPAPSAAGGRSALQRAGSGPGRRTAGGDRARRGDRAGRGRGDARLRASHRGPPHRRSGRLEPRPAARLAGVGTIGLLARTVRLVASARGLHSSYMSSMMAQLPPRPTDATLSVTKAARLLGVHPNTVRTWSDAGRLRYYRINARGDRRYRLGDLQRFLAAAESAATDGPGGSAAARRHHDLGDRARRWTPRPARPSRGFAARGRWRGSPWRGATPPRPRPARPYRPPDGRRQRPR